MSFSNSQGGFVNTEVLTPSSAAKKGGSEIRRPQNVVPLIIQQIHYCKREDVVLFGMSVQIAHLVGILKNFEVQSTKATCTIEDYSARIKAVLWLDQGEQGKAELPPVKEGSYVQVFGTIRHRDGEKMVVILKMFPVDDCNIITNHLWQVICVKLEAEAAQKRRKAVSQNHPGKSLAQSMSMFDEGATSTATSVLSNIQQKIFTLLRENSNPEGAHIKMILSKFSPDQERKVREELEVLISEGHIYTTIDSDHFTATDRI